MPGTTAFPGALDTTTTLPTASTLSGIELDGDGTANNIHSNVHGVTGGAVIALETKLGSGSTSPTLTAVLVGTGSGTSAWDTTPAFGAITATTINGVGTATIDGDLAFTGTQKITTSAGVLTLNPATDVILGSATAGADNGNLVLGGGTAGISHDGLGERRLQILSTYNIGASIMLAQYSNDTNLPQINFSKSRATTVQGSSSAATGLDANDKLGQIDWYGNDQTNEAHAGASIYVAAEADFTENDLPSYMVFSTNAGGTGVTERMRIASDGLVTLPDAGGLVVGHTAQLAAGEATAETQIVGTVTNGDGALLIYVANTANTHTPSIRFVKNANATIGTNSTAVANDEEIVVIRGYGTDGTDADTLIGELRLEVDDGSPGTGAIGGAWVVFTAKTDGTRTEAVRIDSSQNTTFSGNITLGENGIILDHAIGTDLAFSGITTTGTAGSSMVVGDVIVLSADNAWDPANADAAAADALGTGMLGIALTAASSGDIDILLQGFIRVDGVYGFTSAGLPLYLDDTAGDMLQTAPSASGDFVRIVGYAHDDDDTIYFNPDNTWVEVA